MMNLKFFSLIGAAFALGSCAVLSSLPAPSVSAQSPVKENLVGLFYVSRNNLNQQYRGEVFPIARYSNGRYTDVSVDVTTDIRENTTEAEIVKRNAAKSILKSNPTLSVLNTQNQKSADFSVNSLGVGQFSCSSLLIGRGKLSGSSDLQKIFNQIPRDREDEFRGSINGKPFDETRRWTLALQSPTPPVPSVQLTPAQSAQYRKDLVRIGNAEIAKKAEVKTVTGAIVIEEMQVFDLDRDGKPEIFAKVRKGKDPKTVGRRGNGKAVAAYAYIWLSYAKPQPTLLASLIVPYFTPVSDAYRSYQVIGLIDADGDGKQEVLIRNTYYEGTDYSIFKLQGNQLKSVYQGAGYGC